jgi:hypothetical protein
MPSNESVAGSGTLLEASLVQCAASKHVSDLLKHPGDDGALSGKPPPQVKGWAGEAKLATASNWLDDPAQMAHKPTASMAAQLKPLAPPKLRPVTDSVFKSSARALEAVVAELAVLKVESNDDVLKVTS